MAWASPAALRLNLAEVPDDSQFCAASWHGALRFCASAKRSGAIKTAKEVEA